MAALEQLNIKSVVGPTFKQLVGATYTTKTQTTRAVVLDAPGASKAGPLVQSAIARPADSSQPDPDAVKFIFALALLMNSMGSPLANIAGSSDDSSAFAGSKSLHAYNALLDACLFFYQTLQPDLDSDTADLFVGAYNQAVTQYNIAVTKTNAILSTCTVHTH